MQRNDGPRGLGEQDAEHVPLADDGLHELQLVLPRLPQLLQLTESLIQLALELRDPETTTAAFSNIREARPGVPGPFLLEGQ